METVDGDARRRTQRGERRVGRFAFDTENGVRRSCLWGVHRTGHVGVRRWNDGQMKKRDEGKMVAKSQSLT